jgi:hypothetical protein
MLFGLSPFNPVAYVGVLSFLVTVALAATCLPAWRASKARSKTEDNARSFCNRQSSRMANMLERQKKSASDDHPVDGQRLGSRSKGGQSRMKVRSVLRAPIAR